MAGAEIHGGKVQAMPLNLHRFLDIRIDGWMEQQAGGAVGPGGFTIVPAFLGTQILS
jgi:hypothetical protein